MSVCVRVCVCDNDSDFVSVLTSMCAPAELCTWYTHKNFVISFKNSSSFVISHFVARHSI